MKYSPVNNSIFIVFISTLIAIGLPSINGRAEEKRFRVDSFIPGKFIDLEWEVYGSFNLGGSNFDETRYSAQFNEIYGTTERDNSSQDFHFRNIFNYEYTTPDRFFEFTSGAQAYLAHANDEDEFYSEDDDSESRNLLNDYLNYSISFTPEMETGLYFYSNLYSSIQTEWYTSFYSKPDWETNEDRTNIRTFRDTVFVHTDEYLQKGDSYTRYNTVDVALNTGWGRVYEGQFASTALYIIDELRESYLIDIEPTYEQMIALTGIIYQRRLQHTIDDRIHRIETVNRIMEYLSKYNLIKKDNAHATVIVQDIWDYFPDEPRKFGLRFKGGIGLEYSRNTSDDSRQYTNKDYRYNYPAGSPEDVDTTSYTETVTDSYRHEKFLNTAPYFKIGVEYFRPLNHKWQFDSEIVGKYFFEERNEEIQTSLPAYYSRKYVNDQFDHYEFNFDFTLTYILNSRTSLEFHNSCFWEQQEYYETSWNKFNGPEYEIGPKYRNSISDLRMDSRFTAVYRIAIPTSLYVSASYYYRNFDSEIESINRSTEETMDGYSFYVSVSHNIF
ncbi:MAG: hypothetical protein GF307_09400 [candidate division Zixibacteria bacterium]|nr:hypothetical protein [candidate division Zixibacteria bacterium]